MGLKICKSSLKGCVVVVTFIQLICSIIGVIVVVCYGLVKVVDSVSGKASKSGDFYEVGHLQLSGGTLIVILLVLALVSVFLAKVLYVGVNDKDGKKCLYWIVANLVILTVLVVMLFDVWICQRGTKMSVFVIILTILTAMYGIAILMVTKYWRKLKLEGQELSKRVSGEE